VNIAKNLENAALYFPDRTAIIEEDRKISFFEFSRESNRVASALTDMGVQPGDRAAICVPNSYHMLTFYF
jgi:acyl-CoA synthetase (AMP-forming)/AMP-acid ligase II